jgi:hypothetical protein
LTIDDLAPTTHWVIVHFADVDPDFFDTMGFRIIQGRTFDDRGPRDEVVVDERFARAHWPDGSALGARFRIGTAGVGGVRQFRIVGVSRALRTDRLLDDDGNPVYVAYIRTSPTYHPLTFVARLDAERRLPEVASVLRSIADRSIVRVDTVDARYARLNADTRLAAATIAAFGLVAFVVATTGVYAVMAFLVSGRRREIGIRMALGAGTALGLGGAVLSGRLIAGQLFGVTPTDPTTYSLVATLILLAAMVATWWPARLASRVDPATTLRSD